MDKLRPIYHFQPEKNWMNDPNGPVVIDGRLHLFYQYNPYGAAWGNMTWGHAVADGLTHWTRLPCALFPRSRSAAARASSPSWAFPSAWPGYRTPWAKG